ncbi:type II toxin-antitoxin system PemK/MazF family toxin [Microbacterium aurum]
MATRNTDGGSLTRFLRGIATLFTSPSRRDPRVPERSSQRPARAQTAHAPASVRDIAPGSAGETATIEIDPPDRRGLRITYAPDGDGMPDAGEVVWTWVPYAERDGRGKDRPVLVIGRQSEDRVYAVKLTSIAHDGDRDFLPIGSGGWDSKGRPSWVDIDQLYSVHTAGMRREASALDLERFAVVARALQLRYGWTVGG